ncbi:MAG: endonuclease/exonuclease/phosphatase family protein [Ferruginibacter sp.]
MKKSIGKTIVNIAFAANLLLVLFLLLSDLAPFVNPSAFWFIALMGILFPLLFIATLCFIIFWIVVNRKKALLSIAAILLSIPNIISSFAFNFQNDFNNAKLTKTIRVLTWNVGLMNYEADSATAVNNNKTILKKIKETNADVICLQEFFSAVIPGKDYNFIDTISSANNYPFVYFSKDISKFNGEFYSGTVIFSKYAFCDTQKIAYSNFPGSIIKAGIVKENDTIDIYTTRFQSVKFQQKEYQEISSIKRGSDSGLAGSKNIIKKLVYGYRNRVEQIQIASRFLKQSKRPLIFTGDFNDVPVSYTYTTLKKGLSDAWLQKGAGLGRTFEYISPTLRIDNIFYNSFLKITQVERIAPKGISDHYGLVADFELKK